MPEDAMTFGLRGPVVELYVKQESAEFVQNHLDDACRYVAAHAVWHTCKFYQKKCDDVGRWEQPACHSRDAGSRNAAGAARRVG